MSRSSKRLIVFLIILLIFGISIGISECDAMTLVLSVDKEKEDQKKKVLRMFGILPKERFVLKYTHAVDRLPVEEWFEINQKGEIYLIKVRFIQPPYQILRLQGEDPLIIKYSPPWTTISNMKRKVTSYRILVCPFTEQQLCFRGDVIRFEDYTDAGSIICIDINKQ